MKPLMLAAAATALAAWAADAPAPDPVLAAMRDEIARSSKLTVSNLDAPYFIQYVIDEGDLFSVSASLGGLLARRRDHIRQPEITVRVGDYKFDNTNFAGGLGFPVVASGPRLRCGTSHRLELGDELFHLGAGAPDPPVELVDDGGRPLQALHELVHVDLAPLEELDDAVELATCGHVAELLHRLTGHGDVLVAPCCGHVFPSLVDRGSVASTVELARPSANRVNSVAPVRRSLTERSTAPSAPSVMV